jgi:hypothetical protein
MTEPGFKVIGCSRGSAVVTGARRRVYPAGEWVKPRGHRIGNPWLYVFDNRHDAEIWAADGQIVVPCEYVPYNKRAPKFPEGTVLAAAVRCLE